MRSKDKKEVRQRKLQPIRKLRMKLLRRNAGDWHSMESDNDSLSLDLINMLSLD